MEKKMSQDLLYTYGTGFDRSVRKTVEAIGGKFRSKVVQATGDLYRKEGVYQRISGGGLPSRKTTRFSDSPVSEADYSRRRVSRSEFDDGQFMDWADVIKIGTEIKTAKLGIMMDKFRRQEDIVITQAMLGTAKGGDNGETSIAFDTDNIIPVTLGADSGNTGFTYEKLLANLETFGSNNVDIERYRPCIVISYKQWRDMMRQDEFINLDYSSARPIDGGGMMIKNYMGCDFVVSNIIPYMNSAGTGFNIADTDIDTKTGTWIDTDGTGIRACFSFVQDAALFEVNPDITAKISERADKGFDWYAFVKMSMGAVRMEEEKVNVIPCAEA
jgi:hypothetical protein